MTATSGVSDVDAIRSQPPSLLLRSSLAPTSLQPGGSQKNQLRSSSSLPLSTRSSDSTPSSSRTVLTCSAAITSSSPPCTRWSLDSVEASSNALRGSVSLRSSCRTCLRLDGRIQARTAGAAAVKGVLLVSPSSAGQVGAEGRLHQGAYRGVPAAPHEGRDPPHERLRQLHGDPDFHSIPPGTFAGGSA